MNKYDKEIEDLLDGLDMKDIEIPIDLDDKLNNCLNKLKYKKHRNRFMIASSVIACIIISYTFITPFRTFANDVMYHIFGDKGVNNAKENGYKVINEKSIMIGGHSVKIYNMYVDGLRLSFDVDIDKSDSIAQGMQEGYYYTIDVNIDKLYESIYIDSKQSNIEKSMNVGYIMKGIEDDSKLSGNIQILSDSMEDLIKLDDIDLEIELIKNSNYIEGDETGQEIVGSKIINIDINDIVGEAESLNIKETISDNKVSIDIDKLEVSPTMMYLYSSGGIEDEYEARGIYNFKIESEEGNIYKESLSLSSWSNDGMCKQTIVPSIYYDKSDSFRLTADGILINPNLKSMEIKLEDEYPKKIDVGEYEIEIIDLKYNDSGLVVYIKTMEDIYTLNGRLDDEELYSIGSEYEDVDNIGSVYKLYFDVNKEESYKLYLDIVIKYDIPIDIKIKK